MQYQPRLDALRGLCVLAIFVYHAGYFNGGWIGVQVFFVLSGYLITGILADSLDRDASARDYFSSFYVRRILRIVPVYFAYIGCIALLGQHNLFPLDPMYKPDLSGDMPSLLTYTYNLRKAFNTGTDYGIFFGHLWSLSIEEQFYLIWPLLLFSLSRSLFVRMCVCLVVAGPLLRLMEAMWQWHPGLHARELAGRFVYFFTSSHFDAFALGALLNFTRDDALVERLVALVAKYAFWAAGLLGGWMLLLSHAAKYPVLLSSFGWPTYLPYFACYVWGFTVLNCLGLALIIGIQKWRLVGDNFALRRLGRVSYGFYIFHFPMLWIVSIVSGVWTTKDLSYRISIVAVCFVLTWLVAELSFHFLEMPFLRLKSRFPTASPAGSDVT